MLKFLPLGDIVMKIAAYTAFASLYALPVSISLNSLQKLVKVCIILPVNRLEIEAVSKSALVAVRPRESHLPNQDISSIIYDIATQS